MLDTHIYYMRLLHIAANYAINLIETVEIKMKLDTVKIYSQNEVLRGKTFDVYYYANDIKVFDEIEIVAIEQATDAINLLPTLDTQSINDVKKSVFSLLTDREIFKTLSQFTPEQHIANAIALAEENKTMGWSND